jgi:TPR repeat protein
MANSRQGLTLGEGFYWMAEKLAWGDEGIERNFVEAFKLFQQAADLGFSRRRNDEAPRF